jgi:ketosteroid isomerase-like protein
MVSLNDEQRTGLQALAHKQAIEQCLARHARGIDRTDPDLLKSAYHEDARVNYGFFAGPASEMADMLVEMQRPAPITLHRPSNVWIKIQGDRAVTESYVLAYAESELEQGNIQTLVGGRYLDHLEKRSGDWRITHRTYVLDWNSNRPSTVNLAESSFASDNFLPLGAHGARDPGNLFLAVEAAGFKPNSQRKATMSTEALTDNDIDAMLSRPVLEELLTTYCRAVDRTDADLLASIFHDDATVVTGHFNGPGKEFAREITGWCRDNTLRTFHTVSNQWFDIDGDKAVGETYVIAVQSAPDESGQALDTLVGGRYLDKFERREGTWKVVQHTFVMDWNMSQPSTAVFDEDMFGQMVQGTRGAEDPVYAFWKSAG